MKQKQYAMQIRIPDPENLPKKMWAYVKSSDGMIYKYDTEIEADRMLRMCYPSPKVVAEDKRVVEFITP